MNNKIKTIFDKYYNKPLISYGKLCLDLNDPNIIDYYNDGNLIKIKRFENIKYFFLQYEYKSPLVPFLSINIPYEYYSIQNIPSEIVKIYNDSEYDFIGKSKEEISSIFTNICKNGISDSLLFKIHNGLIVDGTYDSYLYLTIAKILKLPKIPVTLFMDYSIDDSEIPDENILKLSNKLFNPYFIFSLLNDKLNEKEYMTFNLNDSKCFNMFRVYDDKNVNINFYNVNENFSSDEIMEYETRELTKEIKNIMSALSKVFGG